MDKELEIVILPSFKLEVTAEERIANAAAMGIDLAFGGTVRFFAAPECPTQIIMEGKANGY